MIWTMLSLIPSPPPRQNASPKPESLPDYWPMQIKTPYRNGMHNLPSNVSIESPHEIFSLFFDKKILRILAEHTNKYARLHQPYPTQFPGYRPYEDTI